MSEPDDCDQDGPGFGPDDRVPDHGRDESTDEGDEAYPYLDLEEIGFLLPELPEELHSCFEEGPFRHCIECGCELLDSGRTYLIQKAQRDGETLLEMAICQDCAGQVQGKVSEESRKVLEAFIERIGARSGRLPEGSCLACLQTVRPEDEFEVAALARGRHLVAPPLIICSRCHEELEESLSEETRRGGQEFIEKNFPGVPADLGLPFGLVSG
ncbi:MAG: hypothetical protein H6807_12155 [Planctomycetes bacterium]|nr:hypothetical protein [Planctomycetota bacterium]